MGGAWQKWVSGYGACLHAAAPWRIGGCMEIQVSQINGVHIIKLAGRWDTFSSADFEQTCAALVEENMRRVVIDADNVEYISSFGLRSLLNLG